MLSPLSPIDAIRSEYKRSVLNEADIQEDPIQQFVIWFNEALTAEVMEPNAMSLASTSRDGQPSVRTVLLKNVDPEGFVFYTNYLSQKGKELLENPKAALLFFWPELERQVRVQGKAQKVSREASLAYFHSRPLGSQIGAIASPQSQVIENRAFLNQENERLSAQYKDKEVPLPDFWGGFLVVPERIEFWQGGASRLHDRLVYTSSANQQWEVKRLAP